MNLGIVGADERERIRDWVIAMGRDDPRTTGGALTGSKAGGTQDGWSDIDIAFGVKEGTNLLDILDHWTGTITQQYGLVHYWDLPAGASIYRVLLLPVGLEIDLAVSPESQFGQRGPNFEPLFGEWKKFPYAEPQSTRFLLGLGWHHVFHARSSIERNNLWRAEYWIHELRDQIIMLASIRFGLPWSEARGVNKLPETVTEPLKETLVRSLDEAELRRALAAATIAFARELRAHEPDLATDIIPILRKYGGLE